MTPDQLEMISTSAAHAAASPRSFAAAFYDRLFETDPELRALFSDDMSDQYDKLVGELAFLAGAARDLEGFSVRARELGRRHSGYGVTVDMFPPVRQALLHALEAELGDTFDAEHQGAWSALFTLIAQIMLDAAAEAAFTS